MAYRNGTYVAFHAAGTNQPGKSDIDYYNLMKAWEAKTADEFTMINSHDKAAAVRDTSLHATLRLLEEAAVLAHRKLRQERVEHGGGVADQRAFNRRTQADALRIMVDLDDARLTRLGIELDIGE